MDKVTIARKKEEVIKKYGQYAKINAEWSFDDTSSFKQASMEDSKRIITVFVEDGKTIVYIRDKIGKQPFRYTVNVDIGLLTDIDVAERQCNYILKETFEMALAIVSTAWSIKEVQEHINPNDNNNSSNRLSDTDKERINATPTNDLLGQVIKDGNTYAILDEFGKVQIYVDEDPVVLLDSFKIPGCYSYHGRGIPSGFTSYCWYIKKKNGNGYLGFNDYADLCWTTPEAAVKCYTKGIANRLKDKIEQLFSDELEVVFDEDYHF